MVARDQKAVRQALLPSALNGIAGVGGLSGDAGEDMSNRKVGVSSWIHARHADGEFALQSRMTIQQQA